MDKKNQKKRSMGYRSRNIMRMNWGILCWKSWIKKKSGSRIQTFGIIPNLPSVGSSRPLIGGCMRDSGSDWGGPKSLRFTGTEREATKNVGTHSMIL